MGGNPSSHFSSYSFVYLHVFDMEGEGGRYDTSKVTLVSRGLAAYLPLVNIAFQKEIKKSYVGAVYMV